MGQGDLPAGLERYLLGLATGETRRFAIAAAEAVFGVPDVEFIHRFAPTDFPAELAIRPDMLLEFQTPSGDTAPGVIRAISGDEVVVDFNHPLAGHDLTYEVEILDVCVD